MAIGPAGGWDWQEKGVFVAAVQVGTRGRCTLSARTRHELSWYEPGAEVLGLLRPGGLVQLYGVAQANAIRDRVELLREDLSGPQRRSAAEMLLRIQDRCRRLVVDRTDNRLELPDEVAVHLEAVDGATIFAVRIFERLELWSKKHREERLAEPIEFLEDM